MTIDELNSKREENKLKLQQRADEIYNKALIVQELKVLIREKKEELERLKYQSESLLKIEAEQKMTIEKLSNNDE